MNDTRPDHDGRDADERAAAAFRAALADARTEGRLDAKAAIRAARRRRAAAGLAGGLVLALIVAAGVIGLPTVLRPDQVSPAGPGNGPTIAMAPNRLPDDPAPSGWRTEQYRDITFQVPADWDYGFEPGPDWCVDREPVAGRPDRRPYVALGELGLVRQIDCGGPMPADLIDEHAAASDSGTGQAAGRSELGHGFWEVTRAVGSVTLRAVSRDADLAQRIVDSGAPVGANPLCEPAGPVQSDPPARPEPARDVAEYGTIGRVALCQYEPVGPQQSGLRAAAALAGAEAAELVARIRDSAPADEKASCGPKDQVGAASDLAIVIRVEEGGRLSEIFLRLRGCPGEVDQPRLLGGFDDGTAVRVPDRTTCLAVVRPPLTFLVGSDAVAATCARPR